MPVRGMICIKPAPANETVANTLDAHHREQQVGVDSYFSAAYAPQS
jgi:hypothetical protein